MKEEKKERKKERRKTDYHFPELEHFLCACRVLKKRKMPFMDYGRFWHELLWYVF